MSSNAVDRVANSTAYRRNASARHTLASSDPSSTSQDAPNNVKEELDSPCADSAIDNTSSGTKKVMRGLSADTPSSLVRQLQELMEVQRFRTQKIRELQRKVQDGQSACGRMMKDIVELQEALRMRTAHVDHDKNILEVEQEAEQENQQEIAACMAKLGALTTGEMRVV